MEVYLQCVNIQNSYTRSGVDDFSDEELSNEESEENHQDGNNEVTSKEFSPSIDKVETVSSEAGVINKSSDKSPVADVENAEDDTTITKSHSPSPKSNEDETKEFKNESVTEPNGTISDNKLPMENTSTPSDNFEVSPIKT